MKTKHQIQTVSMPTKLTTKNEQGSTIIEVFVALVVIGFVLAGALAAANTTTENIQQAHERGEALKIAEGQVEQLYNLPTDEILAITDAAEASSEKQYFCISNNDPDNPIISFGADVPPNNYQDDDLSDYPADCVVDPENRYHIHVIYDPDEPYGTFLFRVRWERFSQKGMEEVQIVYRRDALAYTGMPGNPFDGVTGGVVPSPGGGGPISSSAGPAYSSPGVTPIGSLCTSDTFFVPDDGSMTLASFNAPENNWTTTYEPPNYDVSFPFFCEFDVEVIAIEYGHATSLQASQVQERAFLVGLDAAGNVTFFTDPTDDIPNCDDEPRPIEPYTAKWWECTHTSKTTRVAIPTSTVRVEFRHIVEWPSVASDYCPPGEPNDACTGAALAESNVNSIHGFEVHFTPVN